MTTNATRVLPPTLTLTGVHVQRASRRAEASPRDGVELSLAAKAAAAAVAQAAGIVPSQRAEPLAPPPAPTATCLRLNERLTHETALHELHVRITSYLV